MVHLSILAILRILIANPLHTTPAMINVK
jgi:hypothetical protein